MLSVVVVVSNFIMMHAPGDSAERIHSCIQLAPKYQVIRCAYFVISPFILYMDPVLLSAYF